MSEQKFFMEYSEDKDGILIDNLDDLFNIILEKIELLDNEKNITAFCEAYKYFIEEYPEDLEYSKEKLQEIFKGKDELKNEFNKKMEEIEKDKKIEKLNEMQNDFLNYEEKMEEFEKDIIEKKENPSIDKLFKMYFNYYENKYGNEISDKFNFFSFTNYIDKDLLKEGTIDTIGPEEYKDIYNYKNENGLSIQQTVGVSIGKGERTFENFSYRSNFIDKKVHKNLINKIFEKAKEIMNKYNFSIEEALEESMIKVKEELIEENKKEKNAEFYINRINELREKINLINGTRKRGTLSNAFSEAVKINLEKLEKIIKTQKESEILNFLKRRIETEDKFKEYYRNNEIQNIKNLFDINKNYLDKKSLSEITAGSPEYKPLIIDTLEKGKIEIANLLIDYDINCGNNIESIKLTNKRKFIENLKKVINFEPKINIDDDKINSLFNDNGEIDIKNKLNPLLNDILKEKTIIKDKNKLKKISVKPIFKKVSIQNNIEEKDPFKKAYIENDFNSIRNLLDNDNNKNFNRESLSEMTYPFSDSRSKKSLIFDAIEKGKIEIANLLINYGVDCGKDFNGKVCKTKVNNKETFINNFKTIVDMEPKIYISDIDKKLNSLFDSKGIIDIRKGFAPLINEIIQKKTLLRDGNNIENDLNISFDLNIIRGQGK